MAKNTRGVKTDVSALERIRKALPGSPTHKSGFPISAEKAVVRNTPTDVGPKP